MKGTELPPSSHPPLLCAYVQHIVSSDKRIPTLILQLSIYVFFRLLQGHVHVAIQASQDPSRIHSRIQFLPQQAIR